MVGEIDLGFEPSTLAMDIMERNHSTFDCIEVSVVQLKSSFIRTLFDWSCI